MALGESWKSFLRGDFKEATNYLFVSQDEVDRGRALDTKLEALTKADFERGLYTEQQYLTTLQNIQQNAFAPGGIFEQEGTDIVYGFEEGLKEGAENIRSGVNSALGGAVNWSFGLIPWQVWALAGIYVAWRMGAFRSLK